MINEANPKRTMNLKWDIHHQVGTVAELSKRLTFRVIADNQLGITPDQWFILYQLWEKDGLTICQLATKTQKDVGNISRIVNKLEALDYVAKQKTHNDNRKVTVHVLPKGYSIRASVHRCCSRMLDHMFHELSGKDQQTLMGLLQKMETNIKNKL